MTSPFPFEEIRNANGDMFATVTQAKREGYEYSQIWAVIEFDDGNGVVYGPPHHFVNVLGYVATVEHHDGETYYEESFNEQDEN